MKFVCDRCQTRYSIADEKVRQRILRIRCKTCSNVITVQAGEVVAGPQDASMRHVSAGWAGSAAASRPASKLARAPEGRREWYVAVDGEEHGPLSCADAAKYIVRLKPEQSVHIWKEGMDGWKRPKDVAIIAKEISVLRLAPVASAAPESLSDSAVTQVSAHVPQDRPLRPKGSENRPAPPPAGAGSKPAQSPGSGPKVSAPSPGSVPKASPPASGTGPRTTAPRPAVETGPRTTAPHPAVETGPRTTAPRPAVGTGLKTAPPPVAGSGLRKAPPPIPGSGPKTAPPPGSGPRRPPDGASSSGAGQPRISQTMPVKPGSGPKPPPASESGPKVHPVVSDSGLETPQPVLPTGASQGVRVLPKLSPGPSVKKGPSLPGLTPKTPPSGQEASSVTPAPKADFDETPNTTLDNRSPRDRGAETPSTPHIVQMTPGVSVGEFDREQKTPLPSKPLPPVGVHVPPDSKPPLSVAHPPAVAQPAARITGSWSEAAALVLPPPPSGNSLFGNVAGLPTAPFQVGHAEAGLSRLTGLAALVHRHRYLKYVVAAAALVVLVVLVILLSWRSDNGKAAGVAVELEKRAKAAAAAAEVEPSLPEERAPLPGAAPKTRSPVRGGVKRAARPTGKATAVGDDPFEAPAAPALPAGERPVPLASSRPRSAPAGEAKAISQSQISEVVRKKENQAGIRTCYERALKRDGRLRAGRLDITVSISERGNVQHVQVNGSPDFLIIDDCIKNAIRHWRFPANVEEYATSFPLILQGG